MLKVQIAIVLTFFIITAVSQKTPSTMNWLEDPSTCSPCVAPCIPNTETNMCCMTKIMDYKTIEKAPMLDCQHVKENKCHHTYVTEYESIKVEVCEEVYDKNCQLTFKKMPIEEQVINCYKPLIKQCEDTNPDNQICQTVYESSCTTKFKDDTTTRPPPKEDCGFYQAGQVDLTKDSTPKIISKLSTKYEIEFDITVSSRVGLSSTKYANVFHITTQEAEGDEKPGTRIPAVFVNDKHFEFCCGPFDCATSDEYELNTLYHFRIYQEGADFKIRHVNYKLYNTTNNNPQDYENVFLYLSDKWSESFTNNGLISNLRITDLTTCPHLNPQLGVKDNQVEAIFCALDKDSNDELSYEEFNGKIGQFLDLLETAYHNTDDEDKKQAFLNQIDTDGGNSATLDQLKAFLKQSVYSRSGAQDRITNALTFSSDIFPTNVKVEAFRRIIFCACANGDDQITEQEISADSCIDVQKFVFHDNYITIDGFRQLDDNTNSVIQKNVVDSALTKLIEEEPENYHKFFRGESAAPCPVNDPNYASIDGTCYYFETNGGNRVKAIETCRSLNGILWEPKTLAEMEKVKDKAFKLNEYGRWWWIGISDGNVEGDWQYDSNGESFPFSTTSIPPWGGNGEPNGGTDANCAVMGAFPQLNFIDTKCDDVNWNSICEIQSASQARFVTSDRREAMSALSVKRQNKAYSPENEQIKTMRQARWLGNTTCEQIPVKICGNGCTFEEGEDICHEKTEHSLIDVPMEICDINPRPVCKFQTKLVPKLIPVSKCFDIPREKCELKYKPKEVEKTLETKWCRPLEPGEQSNESQGSGDQTPNA